MYATKGDRIDGEKPLAASLKPGSVAGASYSAEALRTTSSSVTLFQRA
jgi:hypothetical protein